MANKYFGILTKAGRAVYANALLLGQDVNLKEMAIDDGGGSDFVPDENLTAMPSEVYRAELNSLENDADNPEMVIAELVIPSQNGGFFCRGFGLYTDDGVLFAVGSLAETYKATEEEGSGGELVIQADIVVTDTSALTLKVNPATVLATKETVEKAIKEHEGKENPHPQYLLIKKLLGEFADLSDADYATLLANLRLGEAAKLPAVTGSLNGSGWATIPMSDNKKMIIQWGAASVTATRATQYYDGTTTFAFPIAFPNSLLLVNATPLDTSNTVIETATASIWGNTNVSIRVGGATIKSDAPDTLELMAYVFSIGY